MFKKLSLFFLCVMTAFVSSCSLPADWSDGNRLYSVDLNDMKDELVGDFLPHSPTTLSYEGGLHSLGSATYPWSNAYIDDDIIVSTNAFFVDGSAKNVGIGTASPTQNLTILNSSGSAEIKLQTTNAAGNSIIQLDRSNNARAAQFEFLQSSSVEYYFGILRRGGSPTSVFALSSGSDLAVTPPIISASNGNIGIGILASSPELLVSGDISATNITGTLTTAAQGNITSLGTLTALTVDNLNLNGNTISATSGAITMTAAGGSSVDVEGISFDGGVVTGASSLTATSLVGTLTTAAQGNITSLGTLTALTVDNLNLNGNTISATSGAITMTAAGGSSVDVEGVSFDGGVVTGASSLTATSFVGTLTTAAQPNVTSLGELTALNVSGDAHVTGNLTISNGADIGGNGIPLNFTILEIGDWNMDSTETVTVTHNLTLSKIRSVNVIVRDDSDSNYYNIPSTGLLGGSGIDANINAIDSSNVNLRRISGFFFDSASFDSTSFNRGWIMIWYTD